MIYILNNIIIIIIVTKKQSIIFIATKLNIVFSCLCVVCWCFSIFAELRTVLTIRSLASRHTKLQRSANFPFEFLWILRSVQAWIIIRLFSRCVCVRFFMACANCVFIPTILLLFWLSQNHVYFGDNCDCSCSGSHCHVHLNCCSYVLNTNQHAF